MAPALSVKERNSKVFRSHSRRGRCDGTKRCWPLTLAKRSLGKCPSRRYNWGALLQGGCLVAVEDLVVTGETSRSVPGLEAVLLLRPAF